MKIILSRKGFDSSYGGMPSPILPDGTLLSLPVPCRKDGLDKYDTLKYGDKRYLDIILELNPSYNFTDFSHLDPDIRKDVKNRDENWQAAFGQSDAALSVLNKYGIGENNDLFLFFGWFKQSELKDGKLRYIPKTPDLHIIFGYLQVGEIVDKSNFKNFPNLKEHPHYKYLEKGQDTCIYVAADKLSKEFGGDGKIKGYGCFRYDKKFVLTAEGKSRTIWKLPSFFENIQIEYNENAWKENDGYFHSAARGQEFVFDATPETVDWVKDLLGTK